MFRYCRTDAGGGDACRLGLFGVEGHHELIARVARETYGIHTFDRGQGIHRIFLHPARYLLRREAALDVPGDGCLAPLAHGVQRNRWIAAAVGERGVDVSDLGRHLEAHGLDVVVPADCYRDPSAAVRGEGAYRPAFPYGREHAFHLRGYFRLYGSCRRLRVTVAHGDRARLSGRGVLHLEHGEAGRSDHGGHGHQQHHRERRYALSCAHLRRPA